MVPVLVTEFPELNRFLVSTFCVFGTAIHQFLPLNTATESYRTEYFRYRYPFFEIFCTGIFGTGISWHQAHS
ncbi:hypothetical protein HanRHA438_Chr04g0184631 [Helianthus annuus]|nr:hypothetical protein HanRHA438_Chr04g0184631 [Helianthus annuus]